MKERRPHSCPYEISQGNGGQAPIPREIVRGQFGKTGMGWKNAH